MKDVNKKLREALAAAGKAAREIQEATEEADTAEVAISIAEICERALLFPLRNCDVGTAMEQASRHRIFCKNHAYHCDTCPFGENKQDCEFIWAQLPYETPAAQEGGDHADA